MIAEPLPFPRTMPAAYQCADDGPPYDPARHLALERPERLWTLAELGYDAAAIAACPTDVAITAPFRVLSDQGVAALHEVTLRLKAQRTRLAGNRVPSHLAGGVYRSKFLRDLCNCPVVADFLSEVAGTPLAPHSMPSQQLYVNYAPDYIGKAVDAWHFDGVGFDYVLMVSDPAKLEGGAFQFFLGPKAEATELLGIDYLRKGATGELPAERVVGVAFPAAGYAVFQQGNMVVHRAARLLRPAERTTIVPAYVGLETDYPDPTAVEDMPHYGEPGILAELTRHVAWRTRAKLAGVIDRLSLAEDPETLCAVLRAATADVERVLQSLGDGPRKTEPR